jgi:hypothetical protein
MLCTILYYIKMRVTVIDINAELKELLQRVNKNLSLIFCLMAPFSFNCLDSAKPSDFLVTKY